MFYEERCIDGRWEYRTAPTGEWRPGRWQASMTAPDSVERIADDIRRGISLVQAIGPFDQATLLASWADRLQALARGPQQAGGEDVGAAVERLRKNARNAFNASSDADTVIAAFGALQAEVARLLIRIETLRSTADRATVRADDAEAALREAGRPVGYVYSEIVDVEGTEPVRIKRAALQGEYAQSLPNGTALYAALNGGQDDA